MVCVVPDMSSTFICYNHNTIVTHAVCLCGIQKYFTLVAYTTRTHIGRRLALKKKRIQNQSRAR